METLKMIADWRYNKNGKPENTRDYDDIPVNERDNNNWWYLDGKLEDLVCYDKATVTNCKSGGFGRETIHAMSILGNQVKRIDENNEFITEMYLNDIVNVEIEGIDKPCIGFFWTTDERTVYWKGKPYPEWRQVGLVCFTDDEKSCNHAREKYNRKEYCF